MVSKSKKRICNTRNHSLELTRKISPFPMRCLHLIHSAEIIPRNYLLGGTEWKKKEQIEKEMSLILLFIFLLTEL